MSASGFPILVQEDLRPVYYDKFHCLAEGCRLSCCKGWSITFNKKDYLALRRQSGSPELMERLTGLRRVRDPNAAENRYGEFTMEGGTCALLREDCLCALQAERGPDALPEVCRNFPRTWAYQPSGYLERSLTPACEGVLALLWDLPEGLEFLSDPLTKEQRRSMTVEEDSLLPFFQPIRSLCIDLLQDRRAPLPRRILLVAMALKELAEGERDLPAWLERSRSLPETAAGLDTEETDSAAALFLSNNLHTLLRLRSLSDDFNRLSGELLFALGIQTHGLARVKLSLAPYRAARERFEECFKEREYFMENLMTALFFHLHLPDVTSGEALWKSCVNFCNLYSFYRFMAVMSCREGSAGNREELFRSLVHVSRSLLHNGAQRSALRDELFQNDSATLAHMAILLGG